jgi:hypothetical protein
MFVDESIGLNFADIYRRKEIIILLDNLSYFRYEGAVTGNRWEQKYMYYVGDRMLADVPFE